MKHRLIITGAIAGLVICLPVLAILAVGHQLIGLPLRLDDPCLAWRSGAHHDRVHG